MSMREVKKFLAGYKKLGCFGVVGFFIIGSMSVNYLADFIGKRTHPQRYAQIYGCRGERDGSTYYTNTCDEPIHLRYCFRTERDSFKTVCRTALLKPGEGVDNVTHDAIALNQAGAEIWSREVWACKLPFLPDMVGNINKPQQKERGCRKPDDERAPLLGPDPELQAALDAYEAP